MLEQLRVPRAFLIKYDDIDAEHSALVELLNGLFSKLEDGKLLALDDPIKEFHRSLAVHFEHEESEMREVGYDALEAHALHHKHCLRRVEALSDQCLSTGYVTENDLVQCFDTIIEDIAKADLMFGEYLDKKGLRENNEHLSQAYRLSGPTQNDE